MRHCGRGMELTFAFIPREETHLTLTTFYGLAKEQKELCN